MTPNGLQLLSGQFTNVTPGVTQQMEGRYLRNYTDRMLLVDEMRFEITTAVPGQLSLGPWQDMGLSVNLQVGNRYMVTNGFVPISAFAKPTTKNLSPQYGIAGVGAQVWKLHKPIALSPGEAVFATIQQLPNGALGLPVSATNPYPLQVGMTLVCRQMPVSYKVGKLWMPFVAAYTPPFSLNTAITSNSFLQSSAADLFNPCSVPLFIKELLGYGDYTGADGASPGRFDPVDAIPGAAVLGLTGTLVQIVNAGQVSGKGTVATGIRDFVPFYHAFMPATRAWNVNAVLQPHSFLLVRERLLNWNALAPFDTFGSAYVRFPVGMVGYYLAN